MVCRPINCPTLPASEVNTRIEKRSQPRRIRKSDDYSKDNVARPAAKRRFEHGGKLRHIRALNPQREPCSSASIELSGRSNQVEANLSLQPQFSSSHVRASSSQYEAEQSIRHGITHGESFEPPARTGSTAQACRNSAGRTPSRERESIAVEEDLAAERSRTTPIRLGVLRHRLEQGSL